MESSKTAFPKNNTAKLVLLALLFAIALVLAALENTLPPLPLPFPGLKLGLSNIAIMYALFF
ncbi:MAG TPA: Gx transporter family protein, partial [Clostridia bacterium]|nr:Gx transporter family protein [Clostridia bacterium]